ncbi:MAG: 2,3-bisphosphoglycerate-dependent phosphoglycerate mutase [Hyphomicrobiales bacterium]|nr:2,3-bisphosphoglycerate-dependent phosphoglycerate mutase [Hyphomicrobiales bacterium]
MDRILVLLRHGQSEWNLKNLFTGWKDPALTDVGIKEATSAGERLKAHGVSFQHVFTSALSRAQHTTTLALEAMGAPDVPTTRDARLNERDYGDLSGLNKAEAAEKWGDEQVMIWRRSYETPPPGGESLRDTLARALPYYNQEILPCVLRGENSLVVAHGNSLRALLMVLERATAETITGIELDTGVPVVYRLKADSTVESKVILKA